MGIFDTYVSSDNEVQVQIKIDQTFATYRQGEHSPLPDGVYLGHEGAVVVVNNFVVLVTDNVYDKWGGELLAEQLIEASDPYLSIVRAAEKVYDSPPNRTRVLKGTINKS